MADWSKRFMGLAQHVTSWSKDKSVGVCAVIADKEHRVLSIGYNGFPSGCDDGVEERHERPAKYLYTEHAERNAIYSAAKNGVSLKDSVMYITRFPCADCARAIIQSGIKEVVCSEPDLSHERWGEHFRISLELFKEVGVKLTYSK